MAASTKNNTTGLDETEVNALEELQHSFAAIKTRLVKSLSVRMRQLKKYLYACFSQGHALLMGSSRTCQDSAC